MKPPDASPPAVPPDAAARTEPHDGLRVGARMLLSPWLVWAGHFGFCYVWLAVRCRPTLVGREWAGIPVADLGVWLASLATLVILGWMLGGALLARRRGERLHGIAPAVRIGTLALALLAVVWATVPMLVVPACGPALSGVPGTEVPTSVR